MQGWEKEVQVQEGGEHQAWVGLAGCDWLASGTSHLCIKLCGKLRTQVRWQVACHELVGVGFVPAGPKCCLVRVVNPIGLWSVVYRLYPKVADICWLNYEDLLAECPDNLRWQAQVIAHRLLLKAEGAGSCCCDAWTRGNAVRS